MATPTDDDNADDCISGDSYRCERGFTLAPNQTSETTHSLLLLFQVYHRSRRVSRGDFLNAIMARC